MSAKVLSSAVLGIDGYIVEVEVYIAGGLLSSFPSHDGYIIKALYIIGDLHAHGNRD